MDPTGGILSSLTTFLFTIFILIIVVGIFMELIYLRYYPRFNKRFFFMLNVDKKEKEDEDGQGK